jgi:outer membrane protein
MRSLFLWNPNTRSRPRVSSFYSTLLGLCCLWPLSGHSDQSTRLAALLETASRNNLELRAAQQDLVRSQEERQGARTAYWPELSLESEASLRGDREQQGDHAYYVAGRVNLYRGFQDRARLETSKISENIAKLQTEVAAQSLRSQIATLYFELIHLDRVMEILRADLSEKEKQIQMARTRIDAGLGTRTELFEFELHQRNINSQIHVLETQRKIAVLKLSQLSGAKLSPSFEPEDSVGVKLLSNDTLIASPESLGQSPKLKVSSLLKERAGVERQAVRGQWLPSIDMELQYGRLPEYDLGPSRPNSWAVVAKLSVPLSAGFRSAYEHRARAAEELRLSYLEQNQQNQTQRRFQELMQQLGDIRSRLELQAKNIETARRYYSATLTEYRRGARSSGDLSRATDEMFDAQSAASELTRDLRVTCLGLEELVSNPGLCLEI